MKGEIYIRFCDCVWCEKQQGLNNSEPHRGSRRAAETPLGGKVPAGEAERT